LKRWVYEDFANAHNAADIDGFLTVDLPPEEGLNGSAYVKGARH